MTFEQLKIKVNSSVFLDMIALADCNNFFASCERSIRPELKGKPVMVLSNNDGCIIARSNEAKALGYQMGQPVFKVKDKIKIDKVHLFSGNVAFYREVSQKIMNLLRSECNAMEVYSIDEAFLDFSHVAAPDEKALFLKRLVYQQTKIPISIGIAKTKVLAKLASHIAKKYTDNGVFLLDEPQLIARALRYFSVEELWGIGYRQAKMLNAKGIFQASQLLELSNAWIKKNMGVQGLRLVSELRGIPCVGIEELKSAKKSIMCSRSFKHEIYSKELLSEAMSNFASLCAYKLRKQNSVAAKLAIFIQTNRFKKDTNNHNGFLEYTFPVATNDSIEILKQVNVCLQRIYRNNCAYKRAGVIVSDICSQTNIQLSLFDVLDIAKRSKLMEVYDQVNSKMGADTLRLGLQGVGNKWGQKKEPIAFRSV